MNRNILIGIIIAIIVAVGAFIIVQSSDDEGSDAGQNESSQQSETADSGESGPTFSVAGTDGQSYRATVTSTSESAPFLGTLEVDAAGNVRFEGEQDGEKAVIFLTQDEYIVCQNDQCFSLNGVQNPPLNIDDFNFTDEDANKYRDTINYLGVRDCPAGSCNVWSFEDGDNSKGEVYVTRDTNRVSQVISTDDESSDRFTITYEYTDVSITLPETVQQVPGGI